MKRICTLLSVLLIAGLLFSSSAFAASSDNARVIAAIRAVDGNLANIAEQFLNEDAAYGKTLSSDQADQIIALVNEAAPTYQTAVANHDSSAATFNTLASYYTRALAVANVSGTATKSGKIVTLKAYDNDTAVTAGFNVTATAAGTGTTNVNGSVAGPSSASGSTSSGVNYVGNTAVNNYGFGVAGILAVLAVTSAAIVVYRRKNVID